TQGNFFSGGNIFRSYLKRNREYGHTLAQGRKRNTIYNKLSLSVFLNKKIGLKMETGHVFYQNDLNKKTKPVHLLFFGLKTHLPKQYTDY
ncbi:MAG: hypothetical protein ABEH43_00855, partial [Flavobacteriales bacterium]